jgi:DNA-binding transcriptional MerR regulator
VPTLRISELATAAGVPTSTLRYYERIGLVRPRARSASGYRLYDDDSVERLAFIGRAKRLGMTLDDVATLIEAWFSGECEPLRDQLRAFVSGRIAELRRQIADESAFERQLRRILSRLDATGSLPERCGPDCGCDVDPAAFTARAPATACTLGEPDLRRRVADWQRVLTLAVRKEHVGEQLRLEFVPDAEVTADVARLCAAETECCPAFEFRLDITANTVALTIDGTGNTAEAFAAVLVAQS